MKVNLSLENEVIDIPNEAEYEEVNPVEEVKESFKTLDSFFEAIDNLRHVQANVKKFGVTKELIHLTNTDNQLGRELSITLPYYEDDDGDIDEEELPDGEELIAATEGVISKAKDGIIKAFKWLKEKLIQFANWIKGLFSKKEKTVEAAVESIKPENIAKAIIEKTNEVSKEVSKGSSAKTAADLDDEDDDSSTNYATVMKMVENAMKEGEEKLSFVAKNLFEAWGRNIPNVFKFFSSIKINKSTGDIEHIEEVEKNLALVFGSNFIKLSKEGNRTGYLSLTGEKSELDTEIEELWKEGTAKTLGYGSIKEFGRLGGSLVMNILKAQKDSNRFIKNMETECNNAISAMSKVASGGGLEGVYNEEAIRKMKSNLNVLFTSYQLLCKHNLKVATGFEHACKVGRSMAIRNILSQLQK